ncbi:MAG TPA: antibiotic biosynthesis monooxygenase [Acidimicrobiales bacterium]|nr:antibiotic biosynthesis monooxygenase [Acidimicrobiales bacterium]
MPGFEGFKTFAAPDGERVSIIVFDSLEHQEAWRDDHEHRLAQRRGRQDFYAAYSISVCEEYRSSDYCFGDDVADEGRRR